MPVIPVPARSRSRRGRSKATLVLRSDGTCGRLSVAASVENEWIWEPLLLTAWITWSSVGVCGNARGSVDRGGGVSHAQPEPPSRIHPAATSNGGVAGDNRVDERQTSVTISDLDATADCALATEYVASGIDNFSEEDIETASSLMNNCGEKMIKPVEMMSEYTAD